MNKPKPQEIYRHFKGKYYQVLTLATNSETREEMVVYQALYGDFAYFCRPLWMFTEILDPIKYPEASQKYRFEPVKPLREQIRTKIDRPVMPEILQEERTHSNEHHHEAQAHQQEREAFAEPIPQRKTIEEEALELNMDPRVVAFLDSDSSEQRLQILGSMARDITDDQIDICAMAVDVKIGEGDLYDRYVSLRDSLMTKMRFETNRLRN